MLLKIYNTLTKKKQTFKPLVAGEVKMYVCGPTVYDYLHIGNFRGAIFFNLVRNWLEHLGYNVTYVYNYTDVDDKIIARANEKKVKSIELSQKYIEEFQKDYQSLKLRPHTHNPKVTDYMDEIIKFIKELIDKDMAYHIRGEVLYSIEKFKEYGKLSGQKLEDLIDNKRIDPSPNKKSPGDFILWKPAKDGEPYWSSPWGNGRPGWNIECSAMIRALLGETIDIHGGGIDLIFPHHENEIAQGEGLCNKEYCRYWMHNNFINFGSDKMSKSLGNVVTAREFIKKYHPEIFKYIVLSTHYRNVLNMDQEKINNSFAPLSRVYKTIEIANNYKEHDKTCDKFNNDLKEADKKISDALCDDFNTPKVFASIFDIVRIFNNYTKDKKKLALISKDYLAWFDKIGFILGLFKDEPKLFLKKLDDIILKQRNIDINTIEELVKKREDARAKKDFKSADHFREQLDKIGVSILDGPQGTIWEVKKS